MFDYSEIDIYRSWIMALFLLEDRDFKGFWMKIWNAGVSVITRSTCSRFLPYIKLKETLTKDKTMKAFQLISSETL